MKILFLQKRLLFPANTGGKIRTLNVVKYLAQWHEVTYLCNLQPGEEAHAERMRQLGVQLEMIPWRETSRESPRFYGSLVGNLFSKYPFNVNKDFDPRLRQRALDLLLRQSYDLLICDFVQMSRNAEGLRGPARLLFQHNVEAQIFRRHAQQDRGWLRRQYMRRQWRKMQRYEAVAGRQFDRVVAVSRQDQQKFAADYGWRHVDVIDTAVDTDYFRPEPQAEGSDSVLFVGSLDWLPNQDGVAHFVRHAWPLVRQSRPSAILRIVGRNPTSVLKRLGAVEGVEVVGEVEDVRPFMAQATVMIVPLRVGGGTRLKIFEAMAMQKAMVSTSLGAEGLDVKDNIHLLLADDDKRFAQQVVRLLVDRDLRSRIGRAGMDLVCERYTTERVARQFERVCQKACHVSNLRRERNPEPILVSHGDCPTLDARIGVD